MHSRDVFLLWALILPDYSVSLYFPWFTTNFFAACLPNVLWVPCHNKQHRRKDLDGKPWHKDERKMQHTQTLSSTKYRLNSLRLRLSRKQALPREKEKKKSLQLLNTWKKKKKTSRGNFPAKLPSLLKREFYLLIHSKHGVLKRRPPRENKHMPVQKTMPGRISFVIEASSDCRFHSTHSDALSHWELCLMHASKRSFKCTS